MKAICCAILSEQEAEAVVWQKWRLILEYKKS